MARFSLNYREVLDYAKVESCSPVSLKKDGNSKLIMTGQDWSVVIAWRLNRNGCSTMSSSSNDPTTSSIDCMVDPTVFPAAWCNPTVLEVAIKPAGAAVAARMTLLGGLDGVASRAMNRSNQQLSLDLIGVQSWQTLEGWNV